MAYLDRPALDRIQTARFASSATVEAIPAPGAGRRIVVTGWWLQAQGSIYVDLQAGATAPYVDDLHTTLDAVYGDRGSAEAPVWVLPANTAMNVVLVGAALVTGYFTYFVTPPA